MTERQNLYASIKSQRQTESGQLKNYYRIVIAGYLNQQTCKKDNINPQHHISKTIKPFLTQITGYLYAKGAFYIHILQSRSMDNLTQYLVSYRNIQAKNPIHNSIRIVHQTYEAPYFLLKGWQCDYTAQPGPILIQTDKLQEQIFDRSFQILQIFQDGAKKKKQNASHRIGNMILLSNDDMSILISNYFMSLQEYVQIYNGQLDATKQQQLNYPLPPNIFNVLDFLQIEDYSTFE